MSKFNISQKKVKDILAELKVKDLNMVDNINKLKNQILYNNLENEI